MTEGLEEDHRMSNKAASLVDQAKKWATNYGDFPNGAEGAALTASLRVRAAWDDNDADAVADMFAENGSLLLGDEQLNGRERIRAYLTDWFAGAYKGVRMVDRPIDVRLLTDEVALAVTEGGLVLPGENEPVPHHKSRSTWVFVRSDGDWTIMSLQSSPIGS
ncbi:SgcJ/EcaC family oxidoreductase [Verrucosispora sp. FIM060022]|uniref:SgcJ/EcaC family oxidoreductase n=1 Tax=Verrucosispora sp. FIM060022 TaxID=1479020 RepID=UPI00256EB34D|nr:SgcJ/EcaC family oxidoreductase [Verrucosispora sp. FIM060022]